MLYVLPYKASICTSPRCTDATHTYLGVGHHVVWGKLRVQPLTVLLLDGVAVTLLGV